MYAARLFDAQAAGATDAELQASTSPTAAAAPGALRWSALTSTL
ncbi:hypothetical protein ACVWXU_000263 [Streptomyces sp. TE33382]